MQGVATTPLACLGVGGYVNELLFLIIFPMVVVVVVLVIVLLSNCLQRPKGGTAAAKREMTTREMTRGSAERAQSLAQPAVAADGTPITPKPAATILEKALPPVLQIMFVLCTSSRFELATAYHMPPAADGLHFEH